MCTFSLSLILSSFQKHSVVVMIGDENNYSDSNYMNGYTDNHIDNHNTRKRFDQGGRRQSLYTMKLNHTKHRSVTESLSKEAQEVLLEELMTLKEPSAVDVVSRLLFPLLFVVFNLCYWLIYLDQAHLTFSYS